ncbi:50S ribosomal protein L23 [miscellaneous Crenarchaeota group-1 archaeon SG8-32-1]|uniref:Large ribosomal subunit protein uL23 n=1 Tax=miscellaneous Crenarchaeota group-1 archaeon SG8-32-1 TaxID=1685124 RepID=A0A0M0BM35_9ARCH|nr:MAG: 50S ribosomal protein L23 [miscellaneous Crenarchaeota group-1 archaeon SG8-32-1]
MDSFKTIRYPVMTEVTSRLLETENKLVFMVNKSATKRDIKMAVEELYDVLVDHVNSTVTSDGEKKAFVRLSSEYKATDVAIKLGIL